MKNLAQHYGRLAPDERFSLLVAAALRGDDEEREWLMQTAGKVSATVPDYYPYREAFADVAQRLVMRQLELLANYQRLAPRDVWSPWVRSRRRRPGWWPTTSS